VSIHAKQFSDAHEWAIKQIQLNSRDKTGYYSAAFADWAIAYPAIMSARESLGQRREDPATVSDAGKRQWLREQYGARIDEGMQMLQTALQIDPSYSDAMAYMNLLYRLKATLANSAAEAADALASADEWVGKAIQAKRQLPAGNPSSTMLAPAPPPAPVVPDNVPASAWPAPPRAFLERGGSFAQVTSASTPAKALLQELKSKGFPTGVFMTGGSQLTVYVLAGTYKDAEASSQAEADLTAAGFRVVQ
jgi:tetratricopeptide (TPR) repeat protein